MIQNAENTPLWASFWGKARPAAEADTDWHPAAFHCLDVAAVADSLLHCSSEAAQELARSAGWLPRDWISVVVFLIALHDIGKFSRAFQSMAPSHWPQTLGDISNTSAIRHDALGLALLADVPEIMERLDTVFADWGEDGEDINILLGAIAGHHGRPILREQGLPKKTALCAVSRQAADGFVVALLDLLRPPRLSPPPKGWAVRSSWWLAGLTTLSDWIGSSQTRFPYRGGAQMSLAAYWGIARKQATRAVELSGLGPVAPGQALGLRHLMQIEVTPTPVQALAERMSLPEGPITVVIEDATGGGKTEAALVIAQRLIAASRADGLFVALPTMATADAMFNRLAESYRRLFAEGAAPSLALAHGRADLNDLFQGSIMPEPDRAADVSDAAGESASAQCSAWLAEERRRAFLAHVGVGTIDQALLGVLPAKYAPLRLFGLSRKVLVIDEAHSYDPYVSKELDTLLRFHVMQGGHSVVLSATLPQSRRAELLEAATNQAVQVSSTAYPLVSIASADGISECEAALRDVLRRNVPVQRLVSAEDAVAYLAASARQAGCGIWIRNTVDDVRAGAEALREAGIEPVVFHARFAMGDRLKIQSDVLRWFGKGAAAEDRAPGGIGRVLIGSQVLEQSLDLDADVMVSDLAPIDLLLQRAGRLRRHPERTRPVSLPDCTFMVISPEPVTLPDAEWAAGAAIGGSRFVYPSHILWRSARALFSTGQIAVPDGVRALVEAVYGEDAEAVPPGLLRSEFKEDGERIAQESAAFSNLLKPERGYRLDNGEWSPDVSMPTRLGDDYRVFRLAKEVAGQVVPWCDDPDPKRAWALSEIQLRRSLATDAVVPEHLVASVEKLRAGWSAWQRGIAVLVLGPAQNGWNGCVLKGNELGEVLYVEDFGLSVARVKTASQNS